MRVGGGGGGGRAVEGAQGAVRRTGAAPAAGAEGDGGATAEGREGGRCSALLCIFPSGRALLR